ncbi:hypothetical protein D3C81_680370 [compost metagenome]
MAVGTACGSGRLEYATGVAIAQLGIEVATVFECIQIRGIEDAIRFTARPATDVAVVAVGLVEQLLIARHHHHHQRWLALLGVQRLLGDVVVAERRLQRKNQRGQPGQHGNPGPGTQPGGRTEAKETTFVVHGMKTVSMTALAEASVGASLARAVTW